MRAPMWVGRNRMIDLFDIDRSVITPEFIAERLSRVYRFNGYGKVSLTVAQHCAVGAKIYLDMEEPQKAAWFLVHDAHEAFIGDIIGPIQQALDLKLGDGSHFTYALNHLKHDIDTAIFEGLNHPAFTRPEITIHEMDIALLQIEAWLLELTDEIPDTDTEIAMRASLAYRHIFGSENAKETWLTTYRQIAGLFNQYPDVFQGSAPA